MTEDKDHFSSSLQEKAAQWLVRLRSGSATAEERRELRRWLAEDPDHRREFEQVSNMWTSLVEAKSLFQTEIGKAEALWTRSTHTSASQSGQAWWSSPRIAGAGALMALLLAVSLWWVTRAPEPLTFQTMKGEQRRLALTDGSSVMLNTDTAMTVQFSDRTRLVRLDRGDAWFTVAHDERRPFQVQVANGIVRDIGTQFLVSKLPQQVEVSVLDGIVQVELVAPADRHDTPAHAMLHQGERVSYGMDGRISDVGPFNRVTVGAWKDGQLIFQAHSLAQVLSEIARYRSEDIRLLDTSLADLPVTGVLNIRELDNWMQFLQDALPIRAHRVNAALVLVERAPSLPHTASHK